MVVPNRDHWATPPIVDSSRPKDAVGNVGILVVRVSKLQNSSWNGFGAKISTNLLFRTLRVTSDLSTQCQDLGPLYCARHIVMTFPSASGPRANKAGFGSVLAYLD